MAEPRRTPPSGVLARIFPGGTATVVAAVSLGLGLAVLVFAFVGLADYFAVRDQDRTTAAANAVGTAQESAATLDQLLQSIAGEVDRIADDLSAGTLDDGLDGRLPADGGTVTLDRSGCTRAGAEVTELEAALCEAATAVPQVNGVGVLFDPRYDPETGYRPYANRIEGPLVLGELTVRDPLETDWYVSAARTGPGWTHPRFGRTSQTLLAIYSAPFFAPDGALEGVLIASYTLDRMADDLRWLSAGATGYSMVLSDQGKLLSHPQSRRVEADFSEAPPAPTGSVAVLRDAAAPGPTSAGLITDVVDDVTEEPAWVAYEPIPSVAWTYGAVVVETEVVGRTDAQTRDLMEVALGVLVAAVLFLVVPLGAHRGRPRGLWVLSITAGVVALLGIGVVWYLTITGPRDTAIAANSRELTSLAPAGATEGDQLSAGVFVQSVEFTGANDVTMSGLAWQDMRSTEGTLDPPGFVFPEADQVSFDEQYRATAGNLTRIGWAFTASLRQTFDYSRYPLDRETVWLRMWSADYASPTVMTPDLSSYETLAPSTKPGIEQDFVVEGWSLEASSFAYRDNEYNTSFGLRDLSGTATPELYFNVHLTRSFLDPLMSQLVPLAVVAILLFGVLAITTVRGEEDEQYGVNTLGVLGYSAALFFVVIVSHNDLRSELQAQQIIYLEYFYFASYAAILIVSANAILVGAAKGGPLVSYRANVVPSLLFWPLMNGALLAVTVLAFY